MKVGKLEKKTEDENRSHLAELIFEPKFRNSLRALTRRFSFHDWNDLFEESFSALTLKILEKHEQIENSIDVEKYVIQLFKHELFNQYRKLHGRREAPLRIKEFGTLGESIFREYGCQGWSREEIFEKYSGKHDHELIKGIVRQVARVRGGQSGQRKAESLDSIPGWEDLFYTEENIGDLIDAERKEGIISEIINNTETDEKLEEFGVSKVEMIILRMHYSRGESIRSIAEILDMRDHKVRYLLSKTLDRLRIFMSKAYDF